MDASNDQPPFPDETEVLTQPTAPAESADLDDDDLKVDETVDDAADPDETPSPDE